MIGPSSVDNYPYLSDFFQGYYDYMFNTFTIGRLYNFYVAQQSWFGLAIRKMLTLIYDIKSFLLISQLYFHALCGV